MFVVQDVYYVSSLCTHKLLGKLTSVDARQEKLQQLMII